VCCDGGLDVVPVLKSYNLMYVTVEESPGMLTVKVIGRGACNLVPIRQEYEELLSVPEQP